MIDKTMLKKKNIPPARSKGAPKRATSRALFSGLRYRFLLLLLSHQVAAFIESAWISLLVISLRSTLWGNVHYLFDAYSPFKKDLGQRLLGIFTIPICLCLVIPDGKWFAITSS
jgi:hypothetical protein